MHSYSKYLAVFIGMVIPVLGAGDTPQEDLKPETRISAVPKDEEDSTPVATSEELIIFADCLKTYGVLREYLESRGDIEVAASKDPLAAVRILNAIRSFNRIVEEK
jgi:hypothetical protein